ncbi:MAG: ligase-associated DNA damage response endonuclease PdeM [Pseudomonadota bacterium]
MNGHDFTLSGAAMTALPSGALWLQESRTLAVSDLHLGKAERIARREGRLTPPYEIRETLTRLADVIAATRPVTVICLGDSFDDDAAAQTLPEEAHREIARLMAGKRWIWIAGNHDPAPPGLAGAHLNEHRIGPLTFRHIAEPGSTGEISGHYHPKVRLRGRRKCFLADEDRVILPAFGAYTGGLDIDDPAFEALMGPNALALMIGAKVTPAPRAALARKACA